MKTLIYTLPFLILACSPAADEKTITATAEQGADLHCNTVSVSKQSDTSNQTQSTIQEAELRLHEKMKKEVN